MVGFPATVALLTLSVMAPPAASETISPEQVRKAVERSVPFMKAEGLKWLRNRQCSSCHHVPFSTWSLNEAQRHGIAVDREDLSLLNEWAASYGSHKGVFYQLTNESFVALEKAGLPADRLDELKKIKQTFPLRQDFQQEMAKVLGPDLLTQHQESILKTAAKPGQGGGGVSGVGTVPAEFLLAGVPAMTATPAESRQSLVERMMKTQQKDGSWKHAGQFDANNRPGRESTEVNTAWNAIALTTATPLSEQAVQARDRAVAFLKTAKPGVSTESFVVQALLAHHLGDREKADGLVKDILEQQLADGGWSWLKGNAASDAFATGQVLYALGVMGRNHTDANVQRAWAFLVTTQRADGTWLVTGGAIRKTPKASTDFIFSHWGTGWAVIGLLRTSPEK